MISDDGLYRLAVFFGAAAMLLIILYHLLEVNYMQEPESERKVVAGASSSPEKGTATTR